MYPDPKRRPQVLARPNPNARLQQNFRPAQRVNTQARSQRGPQQMSRMPQQVQRYPVQAQFTRQQFLAQKRPIQEFRARAPVVKIERPGFFSGLRGFLSLNVNPPKQIQQRRNPSFAGGMVRRQRSRAMWDALPRRR
jgi:hypothetical protein